MPALPPLLVAIVVGLLDTPPIAVADVASPPPTERTNVILIVVDDLGWADLGCQGHRGHETPAIDGLAAEGMRFTSAYANAPNCAPTRACLMTGRYPPRHGVYTVASSARGPAHARKLVPVTNTTELAPGTVTFPAVLRTAGYATAMIGKWHLGPDPRDHGFDVSIAGGRAGHPKSYLSPYRNPDLGDGPDGEYLTDRLTDEAVRFVRTHRDRPFFLYLSHYAVHTPVQGRPDLVAKHRARKVDGAAYAAMIESVDTGVGRLLALLDELGLTRRTAVVLLSDNGGHARHAAMGPLRGSKGMLYEGGIRVPLIVRWPGTIAPGRTCDVPVIGLDLFPTILAIAGVEAATESDGESLLPLLRAETPTLARPAIFWHFPAYLRGPPGSWRTTPAGAIRSGDLKLIEFFEDDRLELYDLASDVGETRNLVDEMPERARTLHDAMRVWRERVEAPVPTVPNPAYRAPDTSE